MEQMSNEMRQAIQDANDKLLTGAKMKYEVMERSTLTDIVTHHYSYDSWPEAEAAVYDLAIDLFVEEFGEQGRIIWDPAQGLAGVAHPPHETEATIFYIWENDGKGIQ